MSTITLDKKQQAFYDLYTNQISECPNKVVLEFLEILNGDDSNWENFPNHYYTHLADSYVAFFAGIEFMEKSK